MIDRVYNLDQISEAHAYVEQGHKTGAVVVTIWLLIAVFFCWFSLNIVISIMFLYNICDLVGERIFRAG